MRKTPIPRPDRLRKINHSFGWVDHRLLQDDHLFWLAPHDMAVYLFLTLAADRNGVSFYRIETIAKRLGHLDWGQIHSARQNLIAADLVAFQPFSQHDPNGFYQVLALDGISQRRARK